MSCPLCTLEERTKWHYQDSLVVVLDCATHGTPMWVLRKHTAKPYFHEIEYGREVCRKVFGNGVSFRGPTSIKDHYHEHVEILDPPATKTTIARVLEGKS